MSRRLLQYSSSGSSHTRGPSSSEAIPEMPPLTPGGESGSSAPSSGQNRLPFPLNLDGVLVDDGKMASICTNIFKRIENPGGFSWKLTSQDVKDKYFDEFKKYYTWPEEMTAMVHKRWESKARAKYSGYINELKQKMERGDDKPVYINLEMWNGLKDYWNTPEVLVRSEKARANRMTEVDGPGSGVSKHKGGSRSVSRLVDQLSQTQGLPWDAYSYETFRTLHLKPDGTPLTPKDAKIEARVQELAAEEGEGADRNAIYKKVAIEIKLIKKGRFYGCGDNAESLLTDASSGSGRATGSQLASQQLVQTRIVSLEQQLEEERQLRLEQAQQIQDEREKREQLETQFAATQRMVQQLMESRLNRSSDGSE